MDAAACAIREGRIEMALELLEQGRSLLLTQAGRYRTPVDDLEDTLADEFRAISAKMEASVMTTTRHNVDRSGNQTRQDGVAVYVYSLRFAMPSDKRIPLIDIRSYWSTGPESLRKYVAFRNLNLFYDRPRSKLFKRLQ